VVRAVAGRRSEYRPLVSRLTGSTDPLAVADAIRGKFGWSEFYVADLDAIAARGSAGNVPHYARLRDAGFNLWLDAGIRDAADADRISSQAERVIVGSETLRDLASWREVILRLGPERAVFSLDLRDGRPLLPSCSLPSCGKGSGCGGGTSTPHPDPPTQGGRGPEALMIADQVIADGGRHLIVLDLAHVGTGGGPATEAICAAVIRQHPGVAIYTGGGIRGCDDIRRLQAIGVAGVLLASALHDGSHETPVGAC